MADTEAWPSLYVLPGDAASMERVAVGREGERAVQVPRRFAAVYELPTVGVVDLQLAAEPGRVRISELRITEHGSDGITGTIMGGVSAVTLLERATSHMAILSGVGIRGAHDAARRATRRRVSGERLRDVADAYRRGGVAEVADAESVGERQAFRLVARARDAGLITVEEDDRG